MPNLERTGKKSLMVVVSVIFLIKMLVLVLKSVVHVGLTLI